MLCCLIYYLIFALCCVVFYTTLYLPCVVLCCLIYYLIYLPCVVLCCLIYYLIFALCRVVLYTVHVFALCCVSLYVVSKFALKALDRLPIGEACRSLCIFFSLCIVYVFGGPFFGLHVFSVLWTGHSLTEETLIAYVEYLVDNIYVCVGNRVYRQCVGIPMGTDCAPLLANLFLFYHEYNYMKNLIKHDIWAARRFNNTVRYIDDLLTLNNSRFECAINDIYPPELQLKKATECSTPLSYFNNGKYSTAVYDKRDNFNFNFPHLCSSKPAYGVYISQLVRIGRICSNFVQFKERHYKLTQRLIQSRIVVCRTLRSSQDVMQTYFLTKV